MTINHGMHTTSAGRWHLETPSFHLSIGGITIALDDGSCLLHLPIRGGLLDHWRIRREEVIDKMVNHLETGPTKIAPKARDTRGGLARFSFFGKAL